jgi:hypothetical protein
MMMDDGQAKTDACSAQGVCQQYINCMSSTPCAFVHSDCAGESSCANIMLMDDGQAKDDQCRAHSACKPYMDCATAGGGVPCEAERTACDADAACAGILAMDDGQAKVDACHAHRNGGGQNLCAPYVGCTGGVCDPNSAQAALQLPLCDVATIWNGMAALQPPQPTCTALPLAEGLLCDCLSRLGQTVPEDFNCILGLGVAASSKQADESLADALSNCLAPGCAGPFCEVPRCVRSGLMACDSNSLCVGQLSKFVAEGGWERCDAVGQEDADSCSDQQTRADCEGLRTGQNTPACAYVEASTALSVDCKTCMCGVVGQAGAEYSSPACGAGCSGAESVFLQEEFRDLCHAVVVGQAGTESWAWTAGLPAAQQNNAVARPPSLTICDADALRSSWAALQPPVPACDGLPTLGSTPPCACLSALPETNTNQWFDGSCFLEGSSADLEAMVLHHTPTLGEAVQRCKASAGAVSHLSREVQPLLKRPIVTRAHVPRQAFGLLRFNHARRT